MSAKNEIEPKQNKENKTKRRRRTIGENEIKRKPVRVVSSLGEGKLLDRFQNAINEKESKKKIRERGEKDRKSAKEKREREIAKFKAELDALLDDVTPAQPPVAKSRENKVYVPKLSGTVKGKFEALEQKKKEEEKHKITNEKQRRIDRDLIEKRRVQLEIAQKKEQGILIDDQDKNTTVNKKLKKKPGKLTNNFEDKDRRRMEKEKKKIEVEKQMKLSAELKAVKEYYSNHQDENILEDQGRSAKQSQPKPRKLKTNFDDILREKEETERQEAEKLRKQQFEEERKLMRAAKMAVKFSGTFNGSSDSSSESGSSEELGSKPSRLSSSFTKFDILERERMENERRRIREKRKSLLEEETKLFEEAKRQQEEQDENENEYSSETPQKKLPGALKSSLVNFDTLARQRLEEERNRIHEERAKLLEEEKKHFAHQKMTMLQESEDSNDDDESGSYVSESDESGSFKTEKCKKKRKKVSRTPSKLACSRLNFDALERERMENKRLDIQKQRKALLEEEKKLFDQAKEQQAMVSSVSDSDQKDDHMITPGRLDSSRKKFDFLTLEKMDEERERIKQEKNRLLEEEKRLMEEERRKIQEFEAKEDNNTDDVNSDANKKQRKPKRLDKSFTKFDVFERQRIKEREEKMYEEKARKLLEEKKAFEEARKKSLITSSDETTEDEEEANSMKPKKLSAKMTNFDVLERERIENERLQAQQDKIKQLEMELQLFQEQKRSMDQESDNDDITSNTKELIKSSKNAPRPRRLATSFTQFDILERKRREEERELLQKKKAQQLAEERRKFEQNWQQLENSGDNDSVSNQGKEGMSDRPVKRMNVREKMEAVLKAQEEEERKRIEETKFTRMTVEQQEIYLAKQRQIEYLKEQLAKAELVSLNDEDGPDDDSEYTDDDDEDENYYYRYSDEGEEGTESSENNNDKEEEEDTSMCSGSTNSSGSYSGAPYFVQTLKNLTVTEGDPVRFDANINANPHPKVTWYFKNRLIRNSPDYQYVIKGTQYSLYMNESFLDDVGEYMCKAVNEKGNATSKAYLFVKEA